MAQDADEGGQPMAVAPIDASAVTLLDKITVVSRVGDSAIEQLASVSHVSGEALELRQATTTQDIFFGVPGVTVQSDAKRAASSFNIRGLQDFGRVAVIVDGARQNFQRSGHGTQALTFLDPELVRQVDVIRGPVANTYGSGAIGGVVVFETKDAADFLKEGETWAAASTLRYETNGDGWTTGTTGAFKFNEAVDVLGNLVYRNYDDYDDGDGDTVEGTGFEVLSGLLKTTIRPTENSELKLGWVGAQDNWSEGGNAYDLDLGQNTFTARYNLKDDEEKWLDLHVNLSLSKAGLNQTYLVDAMQFDEDGLPVIIPAGSESNYDLDTYGIDLWNTSRFDTGALAHEVTYGGDWVMDDVVTTSPSGGSDVYTPSGEREVWGAYIQDKMTWDWLEVIGALRYDSYRLDGTGAESSGDRLSPRITVGVSPIDSETAGKFQIYGTYAEGYRSPTVTETLISGLHPVGVTFPFLPNPNLQPETAKTWELGVNYSRNDLFYANDSLRLKAAYFHNDITDFIDLQELSAGDPGCPFLMLPPVWVPGGYYVPACYQYQNFASAQIQGFELEAVYDAGHVFAGLSASIVSGHRVAGGIQEDLITVPSSTVTGSLGFRMMENRLIFGGEVQYNGAPEGNPYATDYTLVNLFASYQASENFRVDFRADNLFDVRYANPLNATTTSPVYEQGLTLKLGATMRFGGA